VIKDVFSAKLNILPDKAQSLLDWRILCWLPNEELGRYDLAALNLAAAQGLPGSDEIDAEICLQTLDTWAEQVRTYTTHALTQFSRKPEAYRNSESYFRVLILVTVLQRDWGVVYNPAKLADDAPFETEDSFIHGVIQGNGGTCATLPVIYTAVGRRLGYPIKLVEAWGNHKGEHVLARWVGGNGEEFNIEASGHGLSTPPDNYYREGRYKMPPVIEDRGCFLQSMTPRMELALFVRQRAHCWERVGNLRCACQAWAWALSLHPENALTENTLQLKLNEWRQWLNIRTPPAFPEIWMGQPPNRYFPDTLPSAYERDILGLSAHENLLLDPNSPTIWERMGRGEQQGKGRIRAMVDFEPDGCCRVTIQQRT
jgi:hypothetical protein